MISEPPISARNRKFESTPLQRGVNGELGGCLFLLPLLNDAISIYFEHATLASPTVRRMSSLTGDPAGRSGREQRTALWVEQASLCSARQWIMAARANWKGVLKAGEVSSPLS